MFGRLRVAAILTGIVAFLSLPTVATAEYALREGDTVVFLGDSITAARTYGKIVENYTLLRYPDRKVTFVNAGIGGDTAAGGLARLERDVFARGATVVTVAFGVNDIGWGTKADAEHKAAYLAGIRGIVHACRKRGVRVYICSAAVTAEDPASAEKGFLQTMCDEGMELSRRLGGEAIDVARTMRGIQRRVVAANKEVGDKGRRESLHVEDGVHLNELGQLAMAFAILKGLGAPADVSNVEIDGREPRVLAATGCAVTDTALRDGRLEFTRLDEGLPFNYDLLFELNYRFVPVPDELNRYMLRVTNLREGKYEIAANGRGIGSFSAAELAMGVNIASSTSDPWQPGGPWAAQGLALRLLTNARHEADAAHSLSSRYLRSSEIANQLEANLHGLNDELVAMQRAVATPQPYLFAITPNVTARSLPNAPR